VRQSYEQKNETLCPSSIENQSTSKHNSFYFHFFSINKNKFIFRATYGNSIVCIIFPAYKMTQETSDILK
jgi:hypothetical protein